MQNKNKVAFFDIDDTIYKGGLIFPLMEAEARDGLLDQKHVDEVYGYKNQKEKGLLQYEQLSKKVVLAWALGLKDNSYSIIAKHAEEFILKDSHNFYSFTKPLLELLEETHDCVIITNEPQFVAEPIMRLFGFSKYLSTIFEVNNGKLTGVVSRFNSTLGDKKRSIQEAFVGYSRNKSIAFGDSVGDIGMFEEVAFPICVNVSQELKMVAIQRAWKLANSNNILKVTSECL